MTRPALISYAISSVLAVALFLSIGAVAPGHASALTDKVGQCTNITITAEQLAMVKDLYNGIDLSDPATKYVVIGRGSGRYYVYFPQTSAELFTFGGSLSGGIAYIKLIDSPNTYKNVSYTQFNNGWTGVNNGPTTLPGFAVNFGNSTFECIAYSQNVDLDTLFFAKSDFGPVPTPTEPEPPGGSSVDISEQLYKAIGVSVAVVLAGYVVYSFRYRGPRA